MKRLLLVASTTGYQTQLFLEAAQRLSIEVILASNRCHILDDPWRDQAIPIRFDDPASAAQAAAGLHADGILALGDQPAVAAAAIAQVLNLPFHPPAAVAACRDKFLARQRFAAAGLLVPQFARIPLAAGPTQAAGQTPYPCVLKPLGLSASRGVIRADSPAQFHAAFDRIAKMLDSSEVAIQVESFIPGREFALEGVVTQGRLQVLALFDKPDPLDGPFFEETLYVTPSRQPARVQQAIFETCAAAVSALGLAQGPVHAEMRVNDAGVWMLEVAARPIGGLCARVLPGLPELLIRHAAGDDGATLARRQEASGVMMIPIPRGGVYRHVEGLEAARRVPGIDEIVMTAKPGQELLPLPEGASYLGFIFASGISPAAVEEALRAAHARLQFEITAVLPVLPPAR